MATLLGINSGLALKRKKEENLQGASLLNSLQGSLQNNKVNFTASQSNTPRAVAVSGATGSSSNGFTRGQTVQNQTVTRPFSQNNTNLANQLNTTNDRSFKSAQNMFAAKTGLVDFNTAQKQQQSLRQDIAQRQQVADDARWQKQQQAIQRADYGKQSLDALNADDDAWGKVTAAMRASDRYKNALGATVTDQANNTLNSALSKVVAKDSNALLSGDSFLAAYSQLSNDDKWDVYQNIQNTKSKLAQALATADNNNDKEAYENYATLYKYADIYDSIIANTERGDKSFGKSVSDWLSQGGFVGGMAQPLVNITGDLTEAMGNTAGSATAKLIGQNNAIANAGNHGAVKALDVAGGLVGNTATAMMTGGMSGLASSGVNLAHSIMAGVNDANREYYVDGEGNVVRQNQTNEQKWSDIGSAALSMGLTIAGMKGVGPNIEFAGKQTFQNLVANKDYSTIAKGLLTYAAKELPWAAATSGVDAGIKSFGYGEDAWNGFGEDLLNNIIGDVAIDVTGMLREGGAGDRDLFRQNQETGRLELDETIKSKLSDEDNAKIQKNLDDFQNGVKEALENGRVDENGNIRLEQKVKNEQTETTKIDLSRVRTSQDGSMVKINADNTISKLSDAELAKVAMSQVATPKTEGLTPFRDNEVGFRSSNDNMDALAKRAEQGDTYAQKRLAELTKQGQDEPTDWRGKSVDEVINPDEGISKLRKQLADMGPRGNSLFDPEVRAIKDEIRALEKGFKDAESMRQQEANSQQAIEPSTEAERMQRRALARAQNEMKNGDKDYMMRHRPDETGATIDNVPEFADGRNYNKTNASQQKAYEVLQRVKNNPEAEVTIYRATTGDSISEGDWVSLTREYAESHMKHSLQDIPNAKILEKKVKAKDVRWAGDSIDEYGYFPNKADNGVELSYIPTEEDIRKIQENFSRQSQQDNIEVATGAEPLSKAADGTPEFVKRYTDQKTLDGVDNSKQARRSRLKQVMESFKKSDNPIVKKFVELWQGDRKKTVLTKLTAEEATYYKSFRGMEDINIKGDTPITLASKEFRHEDNSGHLTGIKFKPDKNTGIWVDANPLTKSDIAAMDSVLKNPDRVYKAKDYSETNRKIIIEKTLSNHMRIVTEVVNDGGELKVKSYYKANKTPLSGNLADSRIAPQSGTSAQVSPLGTRLEANSSDISIVSRNNENVNKAIGIIGQEAYDNLQARFAEQKAADKLKVEVVDNTEKQIKRYYKKYGEDFEDKMPSMLQQRYNEMLDNAPRDKNGVYTDPITGGRSIDMEAKPQEQTLRTYETESDSLPEDFDVKHYVSEQVKAQQKRNKVSLRERIADTTAELKHYLVDDAAAYERYIKDKNERLELREGVDRVRASDMISRQFMQDHGLGELGKMSNADMNEFQQYLIAKRAEEVADQGKATGRSRAADRALIEHVGDKYAAQEAIVRQYTKDMLEYGAENGLISQKLKDDLIKNNPNYVPLNRVFDLLEEKTGFKSKQLGNLSKQSVVQKLKGSERTVENPIESLMFNTMRMVNEAERNKVAKRIADSEAFHEKVLKEGEKPRPGYDTLNYMVDGKKVSYEVPALVAKEMKNLNSVLPDAAEAFVKFAGKPTKWLRAGATENNPLFTISNLVRDQAQTLVTGSLKNNIKGTPKALKATFGLGEEAKDLRAELNRAGIIGSEYRQTYGNSGDLVKQLQSTNSLSKGAIERLKHPIEAIADVIGRTEYFTRAQQYYGTPGDAIVKAQAARNNTLNFSRAGATVRTLNRLIPFLNAGIQGGRATVDSFVKRPIHTALAMGSLAAVAYAARAMAEQQDKELWDRIDDSDKGQNIIIFTPDAHYDSESNRVEGIVKIPIAQMTYPVMDAVNNTKGDTSDIAMLAGDIFTAVTGIEAPNEENGILPVVNQLTPTAVKPFVEAAINKSTYTGNDIVSEYDAEKAPEDKGSKYTTGLARTVASITGIDAPIIDNFIQNWGGGLFKDLTKTLADNPDNQKDGGGIQAMFSNGFVRRFLSGTVTSQYEIAEGLADGYKNEVKNSEAFKNLSSADQEKVLKAITSDMKSIAGIATKVEQGKTEDIDSYLTKRQTGIMSGGFNAGSYVSSVINETSYSGGNGNGDVTTLNGDMSAYGNYNKRQTPIEISDNLDATDPLARQTLEKYNSMTSDEWKEYLNGSTAESASAEYKLAYAKYMNDLADDKLSDVEQIRREKELQKLSVSQEWEKKYRDAYSLASSKADMQEYLNRLDGDERSNTVSILNGLNRKMYDAGIISESTYKSRSRAINNITTSSSKSTNKYGGITSAQASALAGLARTLSTNTGAKARTTNVPTTKRVLGASNSDGTRNGAKLAAISPIKKNISVSKSAKRNIA